MINDKEMIRVKYFYDREEPVHIIKHNKEFLNGIIMELSNEHFIIDDFKKGKQFVFFSELKKPVERYIRK